MNAIIAPQPTFLKSQTWIRFGVVLVTLAQTACGAGGGDGSPATMELTVTSSSPSETQLGWTPHSSAAIRYGVY